MQWTKLETPYQPLFQLFTGHFKQGRGYKTWRSRGTSDWLLIYTLAGKGRFGYQKGDLLVKPGDATLLQPNTLHDYGVEASLESWEFLWVHFQPRMHWLSYLKLPELAPGLLHLSVNPAEQKRLAKRFADVHLLASSGLERREDFAMNALEEVLLWLDSLTTPAKRQLDPRILKTQIYMRENLSQRISLEDLAEVAQLSSSRLSHLFKEELSMSPMEFLDKERLERASRLLELSAMKIQDIANEVGFDNPFYFSRRFKTYKGKSPRAFRAQQLSRTQASPNSAE